MKIYKITIKTSSGRENMFIKAEDYNDVLKELNKLNYLNTEYIKVKELCSI